TSSRRNGRCWSSCRKRVTLFSDAGGAHPARGEESPSTPGTCSAGPYRTIRSLRNASPTPSSEEVSQRLVCLSTQLHALQAAVICQDSVMELCLPGGPASSLSAGAAPPRFARSVSRDTGLDASVDAALLRRQLVLLQEEVNRLKPMEALLAESEKARAQAEKQLKDTPPKGHRRNRGKNHGNKGEKASRRKSCSDIEPPRAPLASQETVDQLDGVHGGSEEDEEPDVVRISPRSDSPRG
ncbi:hypothetical protein CRUP_019592, partial [Coryphaenoides rupestris]